MTKYNVNAYKYPFLYACKGYFMEFFLCVVGMVMIVEGLPYFAAPAKIKVWVQKLIEMPDRSLRFMGFLLMLAGLGLVYLGKS